MTLALLTAALLMGFLGSPHCLGMCGGLVAAFGLSMQEVSPSKRRALIATYHLGRLMSYSLLGLMAGLAGTALLAPFMQGNSLPRILLGLVFIFIGVTMLGAPFLNHLERVGMRFWQYLTPLRKKVFPLTTFPRALMAGLLWGFLPCGLVYGALLMAVVGHSVTTGAMLMFAFGLGTIPMLVATHTTVNWIRTHIGRLRLRQINGAVMVLSGLAVIALPIIMSTMHGADHGGHMNHSSAPMEHAMMSDSGEVMSHDSHDMANMGAMNDAEHAAHKQDMNTGSEQRNNQHSDMAMDTEHSH